MLSSLSVVMAFKDVPQDGINTMFIFFSLCKVVGLVLAMGGIYLLMMHRHYSLFFSQNYIILSAVFTLCSAAFLLCTGFLGTWLSLKDSRCLQGLVRLYGGYYSEFALILTTETLLLTLLKR